ncbi:MAG TPA: 3,4-dehydroadipyl-CoA semialdehyde dehydrogenase [Polyangiaceae bacterium]|jgi:oxepin-CoA hydrolase/3-oxo-5,6-dehydrosuberyl-CoA semialdehyde dehydrogenase
MIELKSHLAGNWTPGYGKPTTLVNPATEAELAKVGGGETDFAAARAYARDIGGPGLRAMTFKQRGEMLKATSRALHQKRDALLDCAIESGGVTRSDAKFDVDGAIGTLAFYGELGEKIGDVKMLDDGEPFQLARSPRLFGAHARVSRLGVAVHVNAFNFPAWGLAEKAACALLAGMPVISKPATSTALLSFRIMELLVGEKILPEGALSFVAGSTGNLLELLDGQDVLAFTGSSSTGATLRGGKSVVAHNVRVNVEADSLNAAVLGPDVDASSDTFNLFVSDVVRDMTQKTGQKCTAIRRVYVPKDRVAIVIDALKERLALVKVGDPAKEETTMGPVATAQQLRDVRAGIDKLATCARVVLGGSAPVSDKGFFVAPTLLVGENPKPSDPVHNHEVFGPCATVMPYENPDDAARLVRAGGGGLVSSVYSDDRDFIQSVVLGIAPSHGRVTIGSAKIAGQAVPPGTVMPSLIHGGPGRAGGGEELGGERGLAFYMHRVALQGDRALLEALLGKR